MPDKGSVIKFKNHNRLIKVPFVIYADFEVSAEAGRSCGPSSDKSFTNKFQKHKPRGFGYHIVCFYDKLILKSNSEDEDVAQIFHMFNWRHFLLMA